MAIQLTHPIHLKTMRKICQGWNFRLIVSNIISWPSHSKGQLTPFWDSSLSINLDLLTLILLVMAMEISQILREVVLTPNLGFQASWLSKCRLSLRLQIYNIWWTGVKARSIFSSKLRQFSKNKKYPRITRIIGGRPS